MPARSGPDLTDEPPRYCEIRGQELTTQASSEAARAPELETSNWILLSFHNKSCSFSKLLRGGGMWRLVKDWHLMSVVLRTPNGFYYSPQYCSHGECLLYLPGYRYVS